jgi:predicted small lipoprotein YifL
MRIQSLVAVIAGLLLAGCGQSEPVKAPDAPAPAPAAVEKKADSTSGGNPITAPVDYLGAAAKAKHTADATLDSAALNQQVQLFFGQEGRFPKDLNELVTMKYMKSLPPVPHGMKIDYNPTSGQVKVVKQ